MVYAKGEQVRQDYQKAAEWYEKAAQQGDIHGMCVCGLELLAGELVEQDSDLGLSYLYYAAQNGTTEEKVVALGELGFVYEKGIGVEVDEVAAQYYYKKRDELTN